MPPVAIAAGVIAVGMIGSAIASNASANAQKDAAMAQLGAATTQQQTALNYAGQAVGAAAPTMQETEMLQNQNQNYQNTLQQQQKALAYNFSLLDSTDPAIKSAASNAMSIMNGESSPMMSAITQQRSTQRQQLVNQLQAQLGPGAQTSTAGMQALNNFDQQTNMLTAQTQQSSLTTLGSFMDQAYGARPDVSGEVNANGSTLGALAGSSLSASNAIQARQMNAYQGMADAVNKNSITPYAGAPYVADIKSAQGYQQSFNQLTGAGAYMLGGAMGGGGAAGAGSATGASAMSTGTALGSMSSNINYTPSGPYSLGVAQAN